MKSALPSVSSYILQSHNIEQSILHHFSVYFSPASAEYTVNAFFFYLLSTKAKSAGNEGTLARSRLKDTIDKTEVLQRLKTIFENKDLSQ